MLFTHIDYLTPDFTVEKDKFIGVKDGKITYIGATRPDGDWGDIYNGNHRLLMSGLVNAHSHAPMTLLRGYGENLPLQRWLTERMFPFEDKLTASAIDAGTRLAIAEMLRFGTVSFSDMYYFCNTMARAVLDTGIKCNLSRGITVFDGSPYEKIAGYRDNCDLLANYHGAGEGRLQVDLSIHAEYTNPPHIVAAVAQHAKQAGVGMHIHMSETQSEHADCKARHGMTPAEFFAAQGVFDVPTTAAHCVWVEDSDIALMQEKGVTVASCPVSNMKLASGFAPVGKFLDAGVNIAMGTDGAASNNNLNMRQDMFMFANVYKGATQDPTLITPAQALVAATMGGARAQQRTNTGAIAVGNCADLIVLNTDTPWMTPDTDPVGNLVYAAQGSDVVLTMVDGKVLYQDGAYTTIDIEKIKFEAAQSTKNIIAQL